jgi:hypothetical protein
MARAISRAFCVGLFVLTTAVTASAEPLKLMFTTTLDYANMHFPGAVDSITPLGIVAGAEVKGTLTINRDPIPAHTDGRIWEFYSRGDFGSLMLEIGTVTLQSAWMSGYFFNDGLTIEINGMTGHPSGIGDLWLFFPDLSAEFSGLETLDENILGRVDQMHTAGDRSVDIGATNIQLRQVPEPSTWLILGLGAVLAKRYGPRV